jgi:hypothetical protein
MYWLILKTFSTLGLIERVFAQGTTPSGGGTTPPPPAPTPSGGSSIKLVNPLACDDLVCIGKAIWAALFYFSIPIVSIMVIVGGFQILTAAGDPEKFKTGRKTILYATVGFAVILLAGGVVSIIQNILGIK